MKNMILIAESGSTKCDWLFYQGNHCESETSTAGFNPYFHSEEWMIEQMRFNPQLVEVAKRVRAVYFFGAGCSTPNLKNQVSRSLSKLFTNAEIEVDHDLTAAAYATYQGEPCVSCILGTGSNACFFDGNEVYEEMPSLAFILGDEGSGAYFGKKLLTAYFYRQLPEDMAADFKERYPELTSSTLVEKVYRSERANVFLAGFMRFVVKYKERSVVKKWISEGFDLFLKNQVICYSEAETVPVHFVGSVAKVLESELKQSLMKYDLRLGQIIAKPAEHLAKYVLDYLEPKR